MTVLAILPAVAMALMVEKELEGREGDGNFAICGYGSNRGKGA